MKGKKILSIILASMLSMATLAGCGKKEDSASKDSPKELSNEKIEIKYWVPFSANQFMKSLDESEMYKELEKRTNVHVKFEHPAEGQEEEQFNILVNSKDLPDVIQTYPSDYKGGLDKAVEDGVYLKLNDLIDKYAPNIKKLLENDPELAKEVMTDKGNIVTIPMISVDKNEPAWWGPVIRQDWLEELGLQEPKTIDEWENVLKQFKEKKHCKAPLMISKKGIDPYGSILSAFDIGPGFYKKGDKVAYGYMQPEFKDYLATMNKWYKEGLIDVDFATRDSKSKQALITSGQVGIYITEYALIDQYQAAIKGTDPKAKFMPIEHPVLKNGDKLHYRVVNWRTGGYEAAITTSCKNPERVVKWFDYAFSKEGFNLFNYGIENESYKMVDGKPQFTDLITNNPAGDYWTVCNKWKLDVGPYLRDYKAIPEFSEVDKIGMKKWTIPDDDYVMPPVTLNAEEEELYAEKMTDIDTYKDEMILKFITGAEPLSKFEAFQGQLKKMGIEDVVKIYQSALDRFNSRKIK